MLRQLLAGLDALFHPAADFLLRAERLLAAPPPGAGGFVVLELLGPGFDLLRELLHLGAEPVTQVFPILAVAQIQHELRLAVPPRGTGCAPHAGRLGPVSPRPSAPDLRLHGFGVEGGLWLGAWSSPRRAYAFRPGRFERRVEGCQQSRDALVTRGRVFRQGLDQHRFHLRRHGGIDLTWQRQGRVNVIVDDREGRIAGEGHAAHHQFVQHDAKRIHVRPGVDFALAQGLLGRNVVRRADDRPLAERGRSAAQQARQAEVGQVGRTVRVDDDVGGLYVTVQDALLVGVGQGIAHRPHDSPDLRQVQRPGLEDLLQRPAFHVAHHEVRAALELAKVVDRDDVGVFQPGDDLGLALEPRQEVRFGRQRLVQDLDGYVTIQFGVIEPCRRSPSRPGRSARRLRKDQGYRLPVPCGALHPAYNLRCFHCTRPQASDQAARRDSLSFFYVQLSQKFLRDSDLTPHARSI